MAPITIIPIIIIEVVGVDNGDGIIALTVHTVMLRTNDIHRRLSRGHPILNACECMRPDTTFSRQLLSTDAQRMGREVQTKSSLRNGPLTLSKLSGGGLALACCCRFARDIMT
eukprot:CAMPEP_0180507040 /NCGR_PEP_ID=MMETSP1036_2-20121128/48349_1 /TAXON_ID=632150 /ORGANISM="Azadinium spinosum, Strain 3D9" /LENGTH=112 /DNA_ID=CAMNT_0022517099 /DNA_START=167 /DNA_END=502 /DNA_ORIENTATION=-